MPVQIHLDEFMALVQVLKQGSSSLGLTIEGGSDTPLLCIFIKAIVPGSPAARSGKLRVGDQILTVNGECVVGITHAAALNILRQTPPLFDVVVSRQRKDDRPTQPDKTGDDMMSEQPQFVSVSVKPMELPESIAVTEDDLSLPAMTTFSPPPEALEDKAPLPYASFPTSPPPISDPTLTQLTPSLPPQHPPPPQPSDEPDGGAVVPTLSMNGSTPSPEPSQPAVTNQRTVTDVRDTVHKDSAERTENQARPNYNTAKEDEELITVNLSKQGGPLGITIAGGSDTNIKAILVDFFYLCTTLSLSFLLSCR